MKGHTDIALLSAAELRRRIEAGELSPVEIVEACLARIEVHNEFINAVVTLSTTALDEARDLERRAAAGEDLGLLHGLPVGIKDVTPVAGMRTTYGSPLYADHVPTEDALVVRRLREAGAIVLGKTNTPEFAAGANTFNEVFGRTRNPWAPALSAGGSTGGGAAALASGMVALAQGTDLGGSLRIPASFCGVVGLRPSPGLVPTHPADHVWDDLDVTGPMGRTAEDVALMLQAVCGASPLSPVVQPTSGRDFVDAVRRGPAEGLQVAYVRNPTGLGVDSEVERVCRSALDALAADGASVEEIELDLSYAFDAFLAIRGRWMVASHFSRLDRLDELGENLRGNIEVGLSVTAEQLAAGEQARGRLWQEMGRLFERVDLLLTPCVAVRPFPVEQNHPDEVGGRRMKSYIEWFAPTFIFSLSGLPVASVPGGLDAGGLPVGLQIVGRPQGEEAVLALAGRIEALHPIGHPRL